MILFWIDRPLSGYLPFHRYRRSFGDFFEIFFPILMLKWEFINVLNISLPKYLSTTPIFLKIYLSEMLIKRTGFKICGRDNPLIKIYLGNRVETTLLHSAVLPWPKYVYKCWYTTRYMIKGVLRPYIGIGQIFEGLPKT